MADYIDFLNSLVSSYDNYRTIDGVTRSMKGKMSNRFNADYYPPQYDIKYVTYSRPHPYGGEANNWSESPSIYRLDFDSIAKDVNLRSILSGRKNIRTMPNLNMTMFINPLQGDLESAKLHEFVHMNIFAIPYNLIYFFAQKRYDKMKQNGRFKETFSADDIDSLAVDIESWLYDDSKPLPGNSRNDYRVEPRIDKFTGFVDSLNRIHDSIENENNVYYKRSNLENSIMDFYDDAIREMDHWTPSW